MELARLFKIQFCVQVKESGGGGWRVMSRFGGGRVGGGGGGVREKKIYWAKNINAGYEEKLTLGYLVLVDFYL